MVLCEEFEGTDTGVSLLIPGAVATQINFDAGAAEAKLFGREMDAAVAEENSALLSKAWDGAGGWVSRGRGRELERCRSGGNGL